MVYVVPAVLTLLVGLTPSITGITSSGGACRICIQLLVYLGPLHWGTLCSLMQKVTSCMKRKEGGVVWAGDYCCMDASLPQFSKGNPMGGMCLMGAVTLSFFPFVSWLYIYMNSEMRSSWPTHCKTVI
uniref:Transmembrane protein 220 n=1 Tax=Pelodiscus sinensis TaxID=13735 RepID=K7G5Q5_PELSI